LRASGAIERQAGVDKFRLSQRETFMNVKTSIEGANSLTKNALDHCIFQSLTGTIFKNMVR
jgi:hypothetical protein